MRELKHPVPPDESEPVRLLSVAIFRNRLEEVKTLVKNDPELVKKGNFVGRLPLQAAIQKGNLEMVACLLDAGADVNREDTSYELPITEAVATETVARKGLEMVDLLVKRGADINGKTSYGITAMHRAAASRTADLIDYLVAHGAKVSPKTDEGKTPLLLAASYGEEVALKRLIAHGASLEERDNAGGNALHLAVFNNDAQMVALLLDLGADPSAKMKNGWTPLKLAKKMRTDADKVTPVLVARGIKE